MGAAPLGDLLADEEFSKQTVIAIEAALLAGEILRQGYGTRFHTSLKQEGRHNLVTEYDYKAERAIIEFLSREAPHSSFLAEESGKSAVRSDQIWIIDPLDGTVNFAHQIPFFAVSIALEHRGEVVLGVVYCPLLHELFVAEKGKGAYLNGERLAVSTVSDLKKAIFATGFPYNLVDNPFHCIEHFIDVLRLGVPVRRLGVASLDLAYTAAGRFDAFFEASLAPWDCAAALLMIEEAGGVVSSWKNTPFDIRSYRPIACSNGKLHHDLTALLSREPEGR
jgi:myo-inositol-1(or 4)-monophosphatase